MEVEPNIVGNRLNYVTVRGTTFNYQIVAIVLHQINDTQKRRNLYLILRTLRFYPVTFFASHTLYVNAQPISKKAIFKEYKTIA